MRAPSKIIDRLSSILRKAGLIVLIKEIVMKVARTFLQPESFPTYSQFGEDRVIKNYFGNLEKGFYVDVGCNAPIRYSNTWYFYLRGWQGIAIDANPELTRNFNKVRKSDITLTAAITQNEEEVEFYFSKNSDLISGIGEVADSKWSRTKENSDVVKYKTTRLDALLKQYGAPKNFELLSIDTEGSELNVLQSLCFKSYKPKLICVEIHELDLMDIRSSEIVRYLEEKGYKMISYASPSAFFNRALTHSI